MRLMNSESKMSCRRFQAKKSAGAEGLSDAAGFSLLETLLVVGITVVLSAIRYPSSRTPSGATILGQPRMR